MAMGIPWGRIVQMVRMGRVQATAMTTGAMKEKAVLTKSVMLMEVVVLMKLAVLM